MRQRPSEVAGDPHLGCLLAAGELAAEPVEPDGPVERAERHLQLRVELVQVPAQPLLAAAPLADEVVAVVDEQLQLSQRLLAGARTVEPRLLQRGPGDRERVDRVRLAARAVRGAAAALSAEAAPAPAARPAATSACSSPRVTCRQSSSAHSRSSPSDRAHATTPSSTGQLRSANATADLVDRDRGQRVLVHVHSDHDH